MTDKIFITIPAYEDPFLIRTLDSAISNAKNPKALIFAIALQYKNIPMPDISDYNTNYIVYDVDTRPSINLIRKKLLNFYNGEKYFMMIDSHMLFTKNWDEILIKDYVRLQQSTHDKVIISRQMPPLCGKSSRPLNEKTIWKLLTGDTKSVGYFSSHLVGDMEDAEISTEFFKTNYSSSHFFFSDAKYLKEVGIIDAASIRSEEQVMSFLAFLNGWDIYGVSTINHVGHMDSDYRMALYNDPAPPKRSKFTFDADSESVIKELDKLLFNNTGKFAVKNPQRSPEEFYKEIGLFEAWNKIIPSDIIK